MARLAWHVLVIKNIQNGRAAGNIDNHFVADCVGWQVLTKRRLELHGDFHWFALSLPIIDDCKWPLPACRRSAASE